MVRYIESLKVLFQPHLWLIHPIAVLSVAIALTYGYYLLYQRVHAKLVKNNHFIISALLQAIYWPLIIFVWMDAVFAIIRVFTDNLDATVVNFVGILRTISWILLLAWVFMRFIKLFEKLLLSGLLTKKHPDETIVQAIGKLLRVIAIIIVVLFILPVLGIPASGIVAFGGGSAIVVGVGAQQILANYFGGLIIYLDRNFKVGDWIYSSEKEIEGTVEHIGWRSTQIRTFDKRALYIPNAAFSSIIMVNASRMTHRRIKETIGIRYADAHVLGQITEDIRAMLQAHLGIDQRQNSLVHFAGFGPSSLHISISAFTKTKDWKTYRDIQQEVFLKVIHIIEHYGAALALPARNVYLDAQQQL